MPPPITLIRQAVMGIQGPHRALPGRPSIKSTPALLLLETPFCSKGEVSGERSSLSQVGGVSAIQSPTGLTAMEVTLFLTSQLQSQAGATTAATSMSPMWLLLSGGSSSITLPTILPTIQILVTKR